MTLHTFFENGIHSKVGKIVYQDKSVYIGEINDSAEKHGMGIFHDFKTKSRVEGHFN